VKLDQLVASEGKVDVMAKYCMKAYMEIKLFRFLIIDLLNDVSASYPLPHTP
jgi:hypothetical protein